MSPVNIRCRRRRPGTGHFFPGSVAVNGLGAWALLALVVGASCGPGVRAARGDPAADERKELLRQQRERYEAAVADDPKLDDKSHRIGDLFQLKVQNDRLVIAPNIPATAMHVVRQVELEGMPSPATIVYVASLGRRPGMGRARFDFSAERFDDDSGVYTRLRVMTYYRSLRMTQTYRSADVQWDVSAEQSEDEVRLTVSGTGIDGVNLGAPDLVTLRRRHPREVERWLRPMLAELGQDTLLAPDAQAAWQVLADDWPEDPKARDAIVKTLPDLGAADFHVREAAVRKLAELGLAGATSILRLEKLGVRADLSAEQNRELDAVLSLHRSLPTDQAAALHDDPEFLLDCLSCENTTARAVALHRLQKLTAAASGFDAKDLDGNPDRRATVIATLREKVLEPTTKPSE